MSHAATNWAIQQRGLDPAVKIVLWHLADCHNPAQGCFPRQAYLAEHSELSRASVNRHLATLEQRGLIVRERSVDPRTGHQCPTRYYLACEPDFEQHRTRLATETNPQKKPCLKDGHGAVSQNAVEPCLNSAKTRVSDCDTNPVIEPVIKPTSGAQVREDRDFQNFWEDWPLKQRPDNCRVASRHFDRLTPSDQIKAVRHAHTYRALVGTLGGFAPMIPYLRQRLFLEFDEAPEVDGEGYFVIKPDRPEWDAWLASLEASYGPNAPIRVKNKGFLLTKTRWPQTPQNNSTTSK